MIDRKRIAQYLCLIKSYANRSFVISPRKKNMAFLMAYGLNHDDAKHIVLSLSVAHYSKGPCYDDGDLQRNDVWVFGRFVKIDDRIVEVYIKTVIGRSDEGLECLCVSFHEAEKPLSYPYGGVDNAPYVLS